MTDAEKIEQAASEHAQINNLPDIPPVIESFRCGVMWGRENPKPPADSDEKARDEYKAQFILECYNLNDPADELMSRGAAHGFDVGFSKAAAIGRLDLTIEKQLRRADNAARANDPRVTKIGENVTTENVSNENVSNKSDEKDLTAICEKIGYGRSMQIIAEAWKSKDPVGALTVGPCVGFARANPVDDPRVAELVEAMESLLAASFCSGEVF